jgi:hypothetical protein
MVPLMRLSLSRTMSRMPCMISFFGIGSCPHSGIPGAPTGPAFRRINTVSFVTSRSMSSMFFLSSA